MSAIDLLHAGHPFPPLYVAVGESPLNYLNRLPAPALHIASVAGYPIGAPINRAVLRQICLDPQVTPLAKYACIMAWGGQLFGNFDQSVLAPGLEPLIQALLASANNRQIDFQNTQVASAAIPGLGISFYTKLLFFLRPIQDAYMLDQWTAKSILLLQFPPVIRLGPRGTNGFYRAHPNTTQIEYERFCQAVEALRGVLWPVGVPTNGEQVEMAMFDRSEPDGFWRGFVKINFKHPVAGSLLAKGAESLTQALDYRCGLLVIRRINPPRLFVIGTHGSCCHWSLDDCYRLLLARLRELLNQHRLPITLVLPPGPCPQWFTDALEALGITVETSEVGNEDASASVDGEDDATEPLDECESRPESHPKPQSPPAATAPNAPLCPSNPEEVKQIIWLNDRNSQTGQIHESALRVLAEDNLTADNIGAICRKHGCLDLKQDRRSPRFLIREIGNYAVDGRLVSFPTDPRHYNPPGGEATHCWGGVGYEGGLDFSAAYLQTEELRLRPAVAYLKAFFEVRACSGNLQFNQAWVNDC